MGDLVSIEKSGSVATMTLRRVLARNALSLDLLAEMHRGAESIASDSTISVVVLTGEGKAFCAGMDLKAVLDDPAAPARLLGGLAEFFVKWRGLPAVTLAKVNGAAIGGGCGLATVCDLAITHEDAKLGFPEVDLGVCPAVVAPWLVRKIGAGPARRVLLQGGLHSGKRALDLGIVDHVVPGLQDLDTAAAEFVAKLASGGPNALRATKALLNDLDGSMDLAQARRGAEISASVLRLPDAQKLLREKLAK